jgi:hypothetical protein
LYRVYRVPRRAAGRARARGPVGLGEEVAAAVEALEREWAAAVEALEREWAVEG